VSVECALLDDITPILQYFKRAAPRKSSASRSDAADQFPEPNGQLSSSVLPKAIELVKL